MPASAKKGRRLPRVVPILGIVLGAALIAAACILGLSDLGTHSAYEQLAEEVVAEVEPEADPSLAGPAFQLSVDWEALQAQNSAACAWLRLENTSIDTAVVKASEEDPDYYLNHDLWGSWSQQGCPFLDWRSEADSGSQLVFGHHFTSQNWGFSDIYRAAEQEVFDSIGYARWATPERGTVSLTPLCALVVDRYDQEVQRTEFGAVFGQRRWVRSICDRASAKNSGWEELVESSNRFVLLVTCASNLPNQPQRTVLVLAGSDPALEAEQAQS